MGMGTPSSMVRREGLMTQRTGSEEDGKPDQRTKLPILKGLSKREIKGQSSSAKKRQVLLYINRKGARALTEKLVVLTDSHRYVQT